MTMQTTIPAWEQTLIRLSQITPHWAGTAHPHHSPAEEKALELQAAVQACEAITARYSRSFHLASALLPKAKRRAMRVLYAFCRTADNLVDENVDSPLEKLEELRIGLAGHGHSAHDPVLLGWADIHARYRIPLGYAEQLLEGVQRDLTHRRYAGFDELAVYCYGVASTVGLMSMHITGFSDPRAIPYAIKLGVALQLTNILRDVAEDWHAGRCYLPLDELAQFGLSESDLSAGIVDERWRSFMRFQIGRTRRLYAEALPGIALLHSDGRFSVAAAALLYRGILDDIEAHDFDVFNRRAFVNRKKKIRLLLQAYRYSRK